MRDLRKSGFDQLTEDQASAAPVSDHICGIKFDAGEVEETLRRDAVNELYAGEGISIAPFPTVPDLSGLRMTNWRLRDLSISLKVSKGHMGKTTPVGPSELLFFRGYLRGEMRLWFESAAHAAHAGQVLIYDGNKRAVFHVRDLEAMTIAMPFDLLPVDVVDLWLPEELSPGDTLSRLLVGMMDAWHVELDCLAPHQIGGFESRIVYDLAEMLRSARTGRPADGSTVPARKKAIQSDLLP